jgi:hypothetical protein
MEQYKKILSNKLFQGSQLSNFQLNTFLEQDNRVLPLGELDVAVNEYEQFTKERNNSSCYRLSGILRGVFSNVLFNVTGERSYEKILELTGNTGEFNPNVTVFQNFGYKDILLERDGWFFYRENTSGTLRGCVDTYLRPVPNDFYFLPLAGSGTTMLDPLGNPRQNWYFKITYPYYANCSGMYFSSPFVPPPLGNVSLCDGIVIKNISGGTINGRSFSKIETGIKHGLSEGDRIIMRPVTQTINEQIFNVLLIEDDYNFWIDFYDDDIPINVIAYSTFSNNPLRFKRIVLGIESQYLVRRFKAITELNDYQIYRAAFSKNIFNDPIQLYHYQLDVDTSPYKDYLNRPITELYLTKIKYTNQQGPNFIADMEPWTELSAGLLLNRQSRCDEYSVTSIYGGTSANPLPPFPYIIEKIDENRTDFFGDIIDYNEGDITERVLEVPYYRFNTVNREDNFYPEGYYYLAHDKIQLLEYSSLVEKENLTLPDVGVPDYAVTIDGVKQWRDLLTPGFFDAGGNGVDYPFLNGCTYIFSEHDLCLYRQNPKQLEFCFTQSGNTNNTNTNNTNSIFFNNTIPIGGVDTFSLSTDMQNNSETGTGLISFPTAVLASPNMNASNTIYTASVDGVYVFDYALSIIAVSNNTTGISPCATARFFIRVEHKRNGQLVNTYSILNVPGLVGTSTYNPTTSVSVPMNVGDTLELRINYTLTQSTQNCNDTDFSITITSGSFVLTTFNGAGPTNGGGNQNSITGNTYNYWLAGINCNNNFGEYIDPIDGDC